MNKSFIQFKKSFCNFLDLNSNFIANDNRVINIHNIADLKEKINKFLIHLYSYEEWHTSKSDFDVEMWINLVTNHLMAISNHNDDVFSRILSSELVELLIDYYQNKLSQLNS